MDRLGRVEGASAAEREKVKQRKYEQLVAVQPSAVEFIPFVFEALGKPGAGVKKVLEWLATEYHDDPHQQNMFMRRMFTSCAHALVRGNSQVWQLGTVKEHNAYMAKMLLLSSDEQRRQEIAIAPRFPFYQTPSANTFTGRVGSSGVVSFSSISSLISASRRIAPAAAAHAARAPSSLIEYNSDGTPKLPRPGTQAKKLFPVKYRVVKKRKAPSKKAPPAIIAMRHAHANRTPSPTPDASSSPPTPPHAHHLLSPDPTPDDPHSPVGTDITDEASSSQLRMVQAWESMYNGRAVQGDDDDDDDDDDSVHPLSSSQ